VNDLVLPPARAAELDALARSHVAEGSISDPETPALLRRVARERLGADIDLRVVVVALPILALPQDELVLVEREVRPGLRSYHLARVPRNRAWRIRLRALARALRHAWRAIGSRSTGAVHGLPAIAPAPGPACRLATGGALSSSTGSLEVRA